MARACENCGTIPNKDVTRIVKDNDDYERDTIVVGSRYCAFCGEEL